MSLIDLGEIGTYDDEPEPPPPRPPRWALRLGVPDGRKASAFAALAVFAAGLAGAPPATPPEPDIRVLKDVTIQSSLRLVDDTLLRVGGDSVILSATDLSTGSLRWSTMIGQPVYRLDGADGTVAIQTGPTPGFEVAAPSLGNLDQAMARGKLTVVDVRTGIERWRHPGALLGPYGDDGALVLMVPSEEVTGAFSTWFLVGVDRRTGRDLWNEPLPDGAQWTIRYAAEQPGRLDPTTVIVAAPDRTVGVVDTATGRRTPMGRLPAESLVLWSWQNLLGVSRPDPYAPGGPAEPPGSDGGDERPRRFEVYDLTALSTPLWGRPVATEVNPIPCDAGILCLSKGSSGFDRISVHTGAVVPQAADDVADLYIPGALGLWQVAGSRSGPADGYGATDTIAFVTPQASLTRQGWIGVVTLRRPRPEILPLARIPISVEACVPPNGRWIVCAGTTGTVVLRQSDLDALIAAARPGRAAPAGPR